MFAVRIDDLHTARVNPIDSNRKHRLFGTASRPCPVRTFIQEIGFGPISAPYLGDVLIGAGEVNCRYSEICSYRAQPPS